MNKITFEVYLKTNWPEGVPEDCTDLIGDMDCRERGVKEGDSCKSCWTYDKIIRDYLMYKEKTNARK